MDQCLHDESVRQHSEEYGDQCLHDESVRQHSDYFGDLLPINCGPEKKNSQVSVWLNCESVRKLPIGNWVNCGDGVEKQCGKMLASRGGEKLGHGNNLSSVKEKFPPLAMAIKAGRHVETVEMRKEITVLASSTQVQGNKQEQEMVEQSSNNLNQIRNQIQDIENQNGISSQKIFKLDTGNQAPLEKWLVLKTSPTQGRTISSGCV